MRTQKVLFGIGSVLMVFLSVLALVLFIPVFSVAGVNMAVGTIITSPASQRDMTGGDTLVATTEYIDMRDVQRAVELYKPYQTPILTLMSDNKKETCNSWEKKYFAIDSRGMSTTVTSASVLSNHSSTLTLANSSFFTKNNTIFFPIAGATKVAYGRTLMGIVTALPDVNKVTVLFVNDDTGLVYTDFSGVACQRGGTAMNPKSAMTTSWAMVPEADSNYVQLFMEQVEIEDFQEKMKKQIDWNLPDMKRQAVDDFKLQLERTFLNGVKSYKDVLIDGQAQRVYTCGGFLQDTGIPVTDNIDLSALTEKDLTGIMKGVFTGNNGMKQRYLFGGADFIEALENITADKKYILAKETVSHLGVDYVKLVSMFGTLNVAYYEQLDLLGRPKDAIVIDKSNVSTADLEPFNIREVNLKESGIAKVSSASIEQTSTMLIKNKTTHAILIGV